MTTVEYLTEPKGLNPTRGAYSHVAKVGNMVYISGQTASDENGNVVGEGDAEAQARQVFANLDRAVRAAGGTPQNIVRLGMYLTSRDHMPALRAGRGEMFGDKPPASTLLIISGLARPEFMIEVDAIACLDG